MDQNQALFNHCLRLGDNCLILGHRLSEWCGHAPVLEQDIATTNIALDLIGQATLFLEYAAQVENKGRTGDDLAFLRDALEFRNALLAEQPNGDFAITLMRQLFFDAHQYHHYAALEKSKDAQLAAIATKSLKEVSYHLRHTAEWIVRIGDGTEESHKRAQNAVNELWDFTEDLFAMDESDEVLIKSGIAIDQNSIRPLWEKTINEVFSRATLQKPVHTFTQQGSLQGKHTEHLGYLLAEMQFLPRAYPGSNW